MYVKKVQLSMVISLWAIWRLHSIMLVNDEDYMNLFIWDIIFWHNFLLFLKLNENYYNDLIVVLEVFSTVHLLGVLICCLWFFILLNLVLVKDQVKKEDLELWFLKCYSQWITPNSLFTHFSDLETLKSTLGWFLKSHMHLKLEKWFPLQGEWGCSS